jgi:hypothetical protein
MDIELAFFVNRNPDAGIARVMVDDSHTLFQAISGTDIIDVHQRFRAVLDGAPLSNGMQISELARSYDLTRTIQIIDDLTGA